MKFNLGKRKRLNSIYELPNDFWKMFEEYGLPEPDEMWVVEVNVEMEEGDPPLPTEILLILYERAIEKEEYEVAEKLKIELEARGVKIQNKE